MFKKIKNIKSFIFVAVAGLSLMAPAIIPGVASAVACNNIQSQVDSGVNVAANNGNNSSSDCGTGNDVSTGIDSIAAKVVNIFSIIVGIVAVLMIIYGGFRYITSGGDSGNVGNAKNTLVYAIVGLVIVALAQLIVHYVLNTAAGVSTS